MPHGIKQSALRRTACLLLLELMRGLADTYLDTDLFGSSANEVLLVAAILVGQIERRPMTASKLATYAGIPRPSVVRKLRRLEARGIVQMRNRVATLSVDRVNATRPTLVRSHLSNIVLIACAELSRMDLKDVAGPGRAS